MSLNQQFLEQFKFFYEWGDIIEKMGNVALNIQIGSYSLPLKEFKTMYKECLALENA
jgi:hypothetical protein